VITFTASGLPEPQGSARAFVRGNRAVITSDNPNLHGWRNIVAWSAQAVAPAELMRGAVRVTLRFTFVRPASVSAKKRPMPTVKPDLDKLTRAVLDALTGVIWADDAQVCDMTVSKRYGERAGVMVEVGEVGT
jgi:Holliday junction resolvase RusA-like endonuclease